MVKDLPNAIYSGQEEQPELEPRSRHTHTHIEDGVGEVRWGKEGKERKREREG